ncbi:hypothetical protein, partial [Sphingobium yanoikuyae]|uniref:hypothetical protein n=1 Tax=Sphingobium yanoikuyae TaxID=13690 RepID=UPI0019D0D28F
MVDEIQRVAESAEIQQNRMSDRGQAAVDGQPEHHLNSDPGDQEGGAAMGLSGFPCVAGHNGQQGVPLCHDAKNLPYRMSFSISFWRAALP